MKNRLQDVNNEVEILVNECSNAKIFVGFMPKKQKMFKVIMSRIRELDADALELLSDELKEKSPEYSRKFLELSKKVETINNAGHLFYEGIELIERSAKSGFKEAVRFIARMDELGSSNDYNGSSKQAESNDTYEFKDLFRDKEENQINKNKEIKSSHYFKAGAWRDED